MKKKALATYVLMIILVALIVPIIMAKLAYCPKVFKCLPGESSTWLGFWASYSGTLATLLVAFLTWMNSRKMEALQRRYYELDTDANLRLSKMTIVPQIIEKSKLNQYKFTFVFDNMAKSLIHEIAVNETPKSVNSDCEGRDSAKRITITIGEVERNLDILDSTYFLQDGKPALQFCIRIDDFSMKKAFAGFYFYFSQFSLDAPKMKLEMTIDIKYGESRKDRTTRLLQAEVLPTPIIEHRRKYLEFLEEEYAAESYEILIENYNMELIKA